jgi:hypothetical protein
MACQPWLTRQRASEGLVPEVGIELVKFAGDTTAEFSTERFVCVASSRSFRA